MGGGLSKGHRSSAKDAVSRKGESTGLPHGRLALGESFFKKSFAVELCAKAGLAPAQAPDGSGDRAAWAALCEGHGPRASSARNSRDRMEHLVRRAMSAPYATPPAALANAFAALDGALDEARVCGALSGCSAAAALLSGDRAYCALLGTCGVVLVTKDRQGCHARELAPRHVLSAGDGGDRRPRLYAAEEGSTLPGYSFARCLGDPAAKRLGVVAEPSVVEHEFGPGDEFLILASESVFDALRSDAFATICEGQDDPWTVAHLVLAKAAEAVSTRGSPDDLTCVVAHPAARRGAAARLDAPAPEALPALAARKAKAPELLLGEDGAAKAPEPAPRAAAAARGEGAAGRRRGARAGVGDGRDAVAAPRGRRDAGALGKAATPPALGRKLQPWSPPAPSSRPEARAPRVAARARVAAAAEAEGGPGPSSAPRPRPACGP
ncbi:protein serine/threonine phosphatase [Aureococcus anophagefferens]|nr:protein serine/threonine phosphatase [Aureococcus anophagefferens]